ncbi:tripartite tricarboxylate transporter permease [Kibdelosporangium aridum]|uniref:Putative tricarboxylic transport membrane protein n=1 Tax=Kibdelosporangium aridum TaxID=2030 RepID=A0A1Y5WXV4_KIBAR|nr:tripartite tricarboxylate transporter permease [Kibdelosporangium aridum]SMC56547.1 putative tricarboxylic transport membrane protein [Kibdelosporangium aridum]
MDFGPVLAGFSVVFEPQNLLYCLVGVTLGMLVGVLPGLGPAATIAILLPITYNIEPAAAVILLAGIFYGAQYGGTITSVLLRLPGEASTVVTVFDGHELARQGKAGSALGIAAIGSFIGGTASIILLTFIAPLVADFALEFGPAEYTMLALIGVLLVATLVNGSLVKGIAAAAAGLLLATVGSDPIVATPRFVFGSDQLADGIDFVIVAMGLFGVAEILYNLEHRLRQQPSVSSFGRALPSRIDWLASRLAILRGSIVGFVLGVLPGGGATMSSFVAYAVEKRAAKEPSRFGKGAIEGVAGPESANNAAATSSFIPLLTLGIPANATMAVLFGALLLQGIPPGPQLIVEHPDVFWGVVNSMYVGNIFLLLLSIPLIGVFVRLLKVRPGILAPLTILITMIGVYSIRNSTFDMFVVIVLGLVGYGMKKLGFEPGPLVLAFVLGKLLESSFRRSMRLFDGNILGFLQRPVSATLAGLFVLAVVVVPILRRVRRKQTV